MPGGIYIHEKYQYWIDVVNILIEIYNILLIFFDFVFTFRATSAQLPPIVNYLWKISA